MGNLGGLLIFQIDCALKVRQPYRHAIIISEINSFKRIHIVVQHLNIQTGVTLRILSNVFNMNGLVSNHIVYNKGFFH